ncbi:MAG: GNAT family N-acetyltransferase [Promethearchaeota archaeon]
MFQIFRASRELLPEVVDILNSNVPLYESIVIDPSNSDEVNVTLEWAQENFETREFYVIRDGGSNVGFATYQNLGKFAYVGFLFIQYGKHGNGYGTALVNYLLWRTKLEKLSGLRLFVNKKAKWALNFYQKLEFTILSKNKEEILAMDDGIMEPFFIDDHVYMEKRISQEVGQEVRVKA